MFFGKSKEIGRLNEMIDKLVKERDQEREERAKRESEIDNTLEKLVSNLSGETHEIVFRISYFLDRPDKILKISEPKFAVTYGYRGMKVFETTREQSIKNHVDRIQDAIKQGNPVVIGGYVFDAKTVAQFEVK